MIFIHSDLSYIFYFLKIQLKKRPDRPTKAPTVLSLWRILPLRLNVEAQYLELYIKGIICKKGAFYNSYVRMDKEIKNIRKLRRN